MLGTREYYSRVLPKRLRASVDNPPLVQGIRVASSPLNQAYRLWDRGKIDAFDLPTFPERVTGTPSAEHKVWDPGGYH